MTPKKIAVVTLARRCDSTTSSRTMEPLGTVCVWVLCLQTPGLRVVALSGIPLQRDCYSPRPPGSLRVWISLFRSCVCGARARSFEEGRDRPAGLFSHSKLLKIYFAGPRDDAHAALYGLDIVVPPSPSRRARQRGVLSLQLVQRTWHVQYRNPNVSAITSCD